MIYSSPIRIALLCAFIQFLFAMPAAVSQQTGNQEQAPPQASAPEYTQKNFDSDARAQNLYKYNNPRSQMKEPWNAFKLRVKQIAAKNMSEDPSAINSVGGPSNRMTGKANPLSGSATNSAGALKGVSSTLDGFNSVLKQFSTLSSSLKKSNPQDARLTGAEGNDPTCTRKPSVSNQNGAGPSETNRTAPNLSGTTQPNASTNVSGKALIPSEK